MPVVYVVMGNDFPDSVFSTQQLAEAYIADKIVLEKTRRHDMHPRIYWRVYPFEIDMRATR